MKYLSILLFSIFISVNAIGQSSFYRTDSITNYGSKIIDNGLIKNASQCEIEENSTTTIYSPYQVQEYKLGNGDYYLAKDIQIGNLVKRVFLLQLVNDKTNLYVYNAKGIKLYFIQKNNGSLLELPKQDMDKNKFQLKLSRITDDCSNTKDAVNFVRYTDISMSKFIKNYNQCSAKPFPFMRYGFIVGYGFRDLEVVADGFYKSGGYIQEKYKSLINNRYKGSFLPGIFVDIPIATSYFSVHADIYLSKFGYSYTKSSDSEVLDFVANTTSAYLPVLFRYTFTGKTLRPFINVGLSSNYNLKRSTAFYESTINPNYSMLQAVDRKTYMSKFQLGYLAGAGIEYKVNYKRSIFVEFRYNKQFAISHTDTFNNTQWELLTSINI